MDGIAPERPAGRRPRPPIAITPTRPCRSAGRSCACPSGRSRRSRPWPSGGTRRDPALLRSRLGSAQWGTRRRRRTVRPAGSTRTISARPHGTPAGAAWRGAGAAASPRSERAPPRERSPCRERSLRCPAGLPGCGAERVAATITVQAWRQLNRSAAPPLAGRCRAVRARPSRSEPHRAPAAPATAAATRRGSRRAGRRRTGSAGRDCFRCQPRKRRLRSRARCPPVARTGRGCRPGSPTAPGVDRGRRRPRRVVAGVGHIHVPVAPDRDPRGPGTVRAHSRGAPLSQEATLFAELLDPVVAVVGDVDVTLGVDRDRVGR